MEILLKLEIETACQNWYDSQPWDLQDKDLDSSSHKALNLNFGLWF